MTAVAGATDVSRREGRLRLLAGERVVQTLEVDALRVTLTDQRVLVSGEEKRLFFFPGASTSKATLVRDVTVASTGSKFLPDWIALIGLGLVLTALFQGVRDNAIWLMLGAAALAAWYFVRTDVLELSVEGSVFVAVPMRTTDTNAALRMDSFVDALFEIKGAQT